MQAVKDHGYMNPEAAHEELGETIWMAVNGIGGWDRVCSSDVQSRSHCAAGLSGSSASTALGKFARQQSPIHSESDCPCPSASVWNASHHVRLARK